MESEWEEMYEEELALLDNSNPIDTHSSPNLVVKSTRRLFSPTKANPTNRSGDKENEPATGQAKKRRFILDEDEDDDVLFLMRQRPRERGADIDAFFKNQGHPERLMQVADLKRARHADIPRRQDASDDDEPLFTSSPPTTTAFPNTTISASTNLTLVPTSDDTDSYFASSPLVASAKRRSMFQSKNARLSTNSPFGHLPQGDDDRTAVFPPSPTRNTVPIVDRTTLLLSESSVDELPIDPIFPEQPVDGNEQDYADGFKTPPPNITKLARFRRDDNSQSSKAAQFAQKLSMASAESANVRASSSRPVFMSGIQQQVNSRNYTKKPTSGGFVSATTSDGRELYFPKKIKATNLPKNSAAMEMRCSNNKSLLETPIWKLMEELDQERLAHVQQLSESFERSSLDNATMLDEGDSERDIHRNEQGCVHQATLWTEKYRPRQFIDLLGDQRLNRDVMKWVKQWDFCVFGKKPDERPVPRKSPVAKKIGGDQQKNLDGEFKANNDPFKRPNNKILLLTGPPGFGKTTLAHVIAKQAGYHVLEINASDDRTGETVKSKIKAAIEMQALVSVGSKGGPVRQKPTLLIIDEIDGASSGGGNESFVKLLVNIVSVEAKHATDSEKMTEFRKKKFVKKPLLRPIICICNDPYAPVLRPLRGVAQIIHFKKIPTITIAKRLKDICDTENMTTDTRTLGHLCELAEGDVRSCLNTLQFMRSRSSLLTTELLDEAPVGRKDLGKSIFSVWDDIFQASSGRKQRMFLLKGVIDNEHGGQFDRKTDRADIYVSRLVQTISTNGEFDKLIQGCFESYPKMKFHDIACDKLVQLGDWLHFYDQINYRANSLHEHSLYGYMPYPLVCFHRFFAGTVHQSHQFEYPSLDHESYTQEKTNESLVTTLLSSLNAQGRRNFDKRNVPSELISLLLRIISPDLRPVNRQLIKPVEKAILSRLVEIMIAFGLTFVQEKTDDGQFVYRLDPPIETLVQLSSISLKNILPTRYAVRQLIAQEIEHENLRRHEEIAQSRTGHDIRVKHGPEKSTTSRLVNSTGDLEKPPMDFFGRPLVIATTSNDNQTNTDKTGGSSKKTQKNNHKIWYKFHEGFSNAVRKPLTIRELW
ncbi:hypothetical protein BC937DRAFT_86802 [Endogone sp. FLAS-F59071]|nr:hypothetical protein BC937DRAFT_86802 [Endogone sp. FLAS-F59071]|eukprot:RUS19855.1 hypothetical protein BC937DRAFT_86802 [Endogone sp. FLAS-F59071]